MTTTPELKIEPQLPVLAFNFEQLKVWATGLTERYVNLVVTEDAIADVKRDMAELNKAKKAVDDARKETVRRVSEPIRAFEAQIKEVCGIFDSAYASLGSQVKAFEDAQREEKRDAVHKMIAKAVLESECELSIPIQDKWLNKTTSMKSIFEDVAAIIERHFEEAQRKAVLEQARQDRAVAIENHVKELNQRHGLDLPVGNFLAIGSGMDLNVSLTNVLSRIDRTFAQEVDRRETLAKRAAARTAPVESEQAPCPSPASDKPACVSETAKSEPQITPAQNRAMSIMLEYDVANEAAVKACLESLKTLCVNFGARYR